MSCLTAGSRRLLVSSSRPYVPRASSTRRQNPYPCSKHAKLSLASALQTGAAHQRPEAQPGGLYMPSRHMSTSPQLDIAGNASQGAKRVALDHFHHIIGAQDPNGFAHAVGKRLRLTQVDVTPRPDEPTRKEARVVCEITIEPDMVNAIGTLHGGCSAFLVDDCSSLPILVLGHELHNRPIHGVSQTISTFYHAPAFAGAQLRIVSTSLTYGARIMSARCEIWDQKNQRLVASGVHTKMQPSPSKSAV